MSEPKRRHCMPIDPDCPACDNSGVVFDCAGKERSCPCGRGKSKTYDAAKVAIKFAGQQIGPDAFEGIFAPDEPEPDEGMLEVVSLLRQFVELVGELPARNVTPGVLEAHDSAVCWLANRDDLPPYDGGEVGG